jgi:guanine deaminase
MDPDDLMQMAIDAAAEGIALGQTPFGCAICFEGRVIAATHNKVLLTTDITAHAEINALRDGCRAAGQILLPGAIVATTCEPCPMCMAALHWARVGTVYFGATIADAARAGFNELTLPARDLLRIGGSQLTLIDRFREADCVKLFDNWLAQPQRQAY